MRPAQLVSHHLDVEAQIIEIGRIGDRHALPVELPYFQGPAACLHLKSFISLLDARLAVVHLGLMPVALYQELVRVLKPGGRLQIGDILVREAVPEDAKRDIDLWTG